MAMTRRAVLKGALVAGGGAIAGAGAYGYAYGRHELEVTRATIPVAGRRAAAPRQAARSARDAPSR